MAEGGERAYSIAVLLLSTRALRVPQGQTGLALPISQPIQGTPLPSERTHLVTPFLLDSQEKGGDGASRTQEWGARMASR